MNVLTNKSEIQWYLDSIEYLKNLENVLSITILICKCLDIYAKFYKMYMTCNNTQNVSIFIIMLI